MDPALKNRLLSLLKEGMEDFTPKMRRVAKYIVDNPADFGLDTIRETARKTGVSTYTLVRMSQRVGFASYDEFRDPFRHALVSSSESQDIPNWLRALSDTSDTGATQAEAAVNSMSVVRRSLERQSPETLEKIADLLCAAPRVYVTGSRASFAMAYYFHYVGRMALTSLELIPRHVGSGVDELNHAQEGELLLAITTTPYSRETIDACRFAKLKGMTLILVADSEVVAPDLRPDVTLLISAISTHHFACYSGVAAVLEGLLSVLLRRGGPETADRIASYERLRRDHAAYWNPKKN